MLLLFNRHVVCFQHMEVCFFLSTWKSLPKAPQAFRDWHHVDQPHPPPLRSPTPFWQGLSVML